jgi:CHAT domain-containing protein
MRRSFLTLLFCSIAMLSQAQYGDEVDNLFNRSYELSKQKNFKEALSGFEGVLKLIPTHTNALVMTSWCHLALGNIPESAVYAERAGMVDQFYDVPYLSNAYVLFAKNDPSADSYLKTFFWLTTDPNAADNVVKDCNDLIDAGVNPEVFKKIKNSVQELLRNRNGAFQPVAGYINSGMAKLNDKDYNAALAEFDKAERSMAFPEEYAYFRPLVMFQIGRILDMYQYPQLAAIVYEMAMAEYSKHKKINAYTKTVTASKASEFYYATSDMEKMKSLLGAYLRFANAVPDFAAYDKGSFYLLLCRAYAEDGQAREKLLEAANLLLTVNPTDQYTNNWFKAHGYMFQGYAYITAQTKETRSKAADALNKSMEYANAMGDKSVIGSVKQFASFYYASVSDYDNAIKAMTESVQASIAMEDYMTAQTRYNNLGAILISADRFPEAVKVLRQAVDLGEQLRDKFEGEMKLNFMNQVATSYRFLVSTYAQMQDTRSLFETQTLERGRMLSDMIGKPAQESALDIKAYQKLLKNDEATLIYSGMLPGQMIINLITATDAHAYFIDHTEAFKQLRDKHKNLIVASLQKHDPLAQMTDAGRSDLLLQDDMDNMMQLTRDLLISTDPNASAVRTEFLQSYYNLLIGPMASGLASVKKLIVMPDGLLNFMPFETLIDSRGKYLVESYDIRYCQSPNVKSLIESRSYGNRPKALLAMGGANFQNMEERAQRVRGADKILQLQTLAKANMLSGRSQRDIYAALGFGQLNYLPGTLDEVTRIGNFFGGKADIFTGNQMTENNLKAMAANGKLKNYKIVHLATHGFSVPDIPQLSGVAMCIFPQVQGGEDGFLTAPEIASLGMQADLAVLSACETGLGKIYGGEGVAGLTQSLLVGGANSAIVSLWPVNDEGTMRFMTGFYELTERNGKSYSEAVNIMKRKFIAGEFGAALAATDIWAPFVHYGK